PGQYAFAGAENLEKGSRGRSHDGSRRSRPELIVRRGHVLPDIYYVGDDVSGREWEGNASRRNSHLSSRVEGQEHGTRQDRGRQSVYGWDGRDGAPQRAGRDRKGGCRGEGGCRDHARDAALPARRDTG